MDYSSRTMRIILDGIHSLANATRISSASATASTTGKSMPPWLNREAFAGKPAWLDLAAKAVSPAGTEACGSSWASVGREATGVWPK